MSVCVYRKKLQWEALVTVIYYSIFKFGRQTGDPLQALQPDWCTPPILFESHKLWELIFNLSVMIFTKKKVFSVKHEHLNKCFDIIIVEVLI